MARQNEEMKFVENPASHNRDMNIARIETLGYACRTDVHLRTLSYLRMKCETGQRYKISEHYDIRIVYRYKHDKEDKHPHVPGPGFPNGNVWFYSVEINCGEIEHPIWETFYHSIQTMQKGISYEGGKFLAYLEAEYLNEIASFIRRYYFDLDQVRAQTTGFLDLSVRVRKHLVSLKFQTVGELIACNAANFSCLPHFEEKHLKEVREKLAAIGQKLAGDP